VGAILVAIGVFVSAKWDSRAGESWLGQVVETVTYPFHLIVDRTLNGMNYVWDRYVYLVGVVAKNEQLGSENTALIRELSMLSEVREENNRLRELLALTKRLQNSRAYVARVVGLSVNPLFRSIRIDIGESHGVLVGDAVVVAEGIVGRVAEINGDVSEVILLLDANHSVDVLVQRTRARGRVKGRGGNTLGIEVSRLSRTAAVQPGDLIVTSGIGKVFPQGLPVAVVTEVKTKGYGVHKTVDARPQVDFSKLEMVLVILGSGDFTETSESPSPLAEGSKVR